MKHRLRCGLLALALLLSGIAQAQDVARDGRHSLKGWELYSWQDGATWRFALLVGTNRLKSCGEVRNPKGALDLAGAERALGGLGAAEYVSWDAPFERAAQSPCPGARPPPDIVERLWSVCLGHYLRCEGWGVVRVP